MPFVSNDGVPVYYEIIGRGEPMVLQHGIFQSTMDWFDAGHVKQLQDNNKLILIDARGHGKSARWDSFYPRNYIIYFEDFISLILIPMRITTILTSRLNAQLLPIIIDPLRF